MKNQIVAILAIVAVITALITVSAVSNEEGYNVTPCDAIDISIENATVTDFLNATNMTTVQVYNFKGYKGENTWMVQWSSSNRLLDVYVNIATGNIVGIEEKTAPTPTIPSGTVQGRVLWNEQPVKGATVNVTDLYSFDSTRYGSATTDANGLFSISGIPEGEQYLYVFGNQPEFWVTTVTPFQMVAGTGTLAKDTYLCKGFNPISPQDGQVINNSRPTLQWGAFPDAVDYAVRVIRVGESNFVFQRGDYDARIKGTSVQVDVDLSPGEYRWRVDGFNAAGHIIACSYWPRSFRVE